MLHCAALCVGSERGVVAVRCPEEWVLSLTVRRPGAADDDRLPVTVRPGMTVGALRRAASADHGLPLERWRLVSRAPSDGSAGPAGPEAPVRDAATVAEAGLFLYRPRVRLTSELSDDEVEAIVRAYMEVGARGPRARGSGARRVRPTAANAPPLAAGLHPMLRAPSLPPLPDSALLPSLLPPPLPAPRRGRRSGRARSPGRWRRTWRRWTCAACCSSPAWRLRLAPLPGLGPGTRTPPRSCRYWVAALAYGCVGGGGAEVGSVGG